MNLQDTCAYYEQFAKEKLVWIELVDRGRFAYDNSGIYTEATTFIMTGEALRYLVGLLNAKLSRWYLGTVAPTSGTGTLRWKKVYVEEIPLPKIPVQEQRPFVELVDQILSAKDSNSNADVWKLEAEMEQRVIDLYGLTAEEAAAVRQRV